MKWTDIAKALKLFQFVRDNEKYVWLDGINFTNK